VVSCMLTPCMLQKLLNVSEVNSPPLSVLKQQISSSISFSTNTLYFLNMANVSDFSDRKYAQIFLLQSSMKVITYLLPLFDFGKIGPQISAWIS